MFKTLALVVVLAASALASVPANAESGGGSASNHYDAFYTQDYSSHR